MICLECGKKLKSITNTHLLKCCGLTMKEYSIKHCVDIATLLSQKTKDSHKNLNYDEIVQKGIETKKQKQIQQFTHEETQIIIGSLLGDGYLYKSQNCLNSTYLILEQGIKQINYLLWKGMKLTRLNAKFYQYYTYNNVKCRYATRNQVRTKSLFIFGELLKLFYNENGKYINDDVLSHLKPEGIAIWYMDDGTLSHQKACNIATQSFSLNDNNKLVQMFIDKYKIYPKILFDTKKMPFLSFNVKESAKLFELIEPYMFYEFNYKIGKEQLPEAIIGKKVSFDSSHFLDEYDGKCSNLHGGRYDLWVYVKGPINPETSMVMDYGYLKTIIDKYIVETFDHHCLNYTINELGWRSTTELISMYIWKVLIEFIPNLYKLQLYETPDSVCEYVGPSLDDMKYEKLTDILNIFQEKNLNYRNRIISEFDDIISNVDEDHFDDSDKVKLECTNKLTGEKTLRLAKDIFSELNIPYITSENIKKKES
jgi:6-pyruvoyl tetrahydropterin synthase/QueD family protein